jgi:hypothetical protein
MYSNNEACCGDTILRLYKEEEPLQNPTPRYAFLKLDQNQAK